MAVLLQRDRLTPTAAIAALVASGTAAGDEQILARVRCWQRTGVRRRAEHARLTGRNRPSGKGPSMSADLDPNVAGSGWWRQEGLFDPGPFYDPAADPDRPWNLEPGLDPMVVSDAELWDWNLPNRHDDPATPPVDGSAAGGWSR